MMLRVSVVLDLIKHGMSLLSSAISLQTNFVSMGPIGRLLIIDSLLTLGIFTGMRVGMNYLEILTVEILKLTTL